MISRFIWASTLLLARCSQSWIVLDIFSHIIEHWIVLHIVFSLKSLIHTYSTCNFNLIWKIEYLSPEKLNRERQRILEKIYSGLVTIVLCQSQWHFRTRTVKNQFLWKRAELNLIMIRVRNRLIIRWSIFWRSIHIF